MRWFGLVVWGVGEMLDFDICYFRFYGVLSCFESFCLVLWYMQS